MSPRIIASFALAFIGACSTMSEQAVRKEQTQLAARCQFQACECQVEDAARGTPAQPVLWRDNGSAYCADGQLLAITKTKAEQTAPAAIMLPDFDDIEDQRRETKPFGSQ